MFDVIMMFDIEYILHPIVENRKWVIYTHIDCVAFLGNEVSVESKRVVIEVKRFTLL
ncbi:hypothetical protein Hanom_Chr02g00171731 [Helianthus anomalus]